MPYSPTAIPPPVAQRRTAPPNKQRTVYGCSGYFAATHSEDSPVTDRLCQDVFRWLAVGLRPGSSGRGTPSTLTFSTVRLDTIESVTSCFRVSGNSVAALTEGSTERDCSKSPPYLPVTVVNTTLRLQALRAALVPHDVVAYIVPAEDAHLSEYTAPRDARIAFMTGFTGSAGTTVVTATKAVLWTDSRYWVQAERQMDCNWKLERESSIGKICDWLLAEFPEGGKIGFDPFVFSLKTHEYYNVNLLPGSLLLTSIPDNLVDGVWTDRPPVPAYNLTRRTWQMKVESIRREMADYPYKPTALLLSALDETAWLFNLRGNDIPHNPFFYSYTLLTMQEIWQRVSEDLKAYLNSSCVGSLCVQLRNYDTVRPNLQDYVSKAGVRVWVGTEYTNYALYEVIAAQAVKDETEQRILRNAHVRDAVAVMQLLMWLETAVPKGKETELSAAHYVNECRSKQKDSRGPSFETISASGPNAALAHYSPTNETDRKLTVNEMYLVDSGGQYLDGTTDITRTVHWGTPTAMQREAFTRVLMGNIEISRTVFPSGTKGLNMEMLARRALWEVGLNYGHGTGHGIGNYFGVHEWPVGFGSNNIRFKEGMFTSIEPGYYKDDDFGIRIEDIAVTVPAHTKYGQDYLTFDTVSLVPYDRKLIDTTLLSEEQIQWLNRYYGTIRERMGPELDSQGLGREKEWMLRNTQPPGKMLRRKVSSASEKDTGQVAKRKLTLQRSSSFKDFMKPKPMSPVAAEELFWEEGLHASVDETGKSGGKQNKSWRNVISRTMTRKTSKMVQKALAEERAESCDDSSISPVSDWLPDLSAVGKRTSVCSSGSEDTATGPPSRQISGSDRQSLDSGYCQRDSMRLEEQGVSYMGPFCGRALVHTDFTPSPYDTESLKLQKGDIIHVIEKPPMGIWLGKLNSKMGSFKFIYVNVLPEESPPVRRKRTRGKAGQAKHQLLEDVLDSIGLSEMSSLLSMHGLQEIEDFRGLKECHLNELNITDPEKRSKILNAVELLKESEGESDSEEEKKEEDTTQSDDKETRDSGCFESSENLATGREEPKTEAAVLHEEKEEQAEPGEETEQSDPTEQLDRVQQKLQNLTVHAEEKKDHLQ
ncbi:hypothetical protein NHX12_011093 [Muraenolepis orangiensis]|uniref:SH3 domain-containing protein n=1 Tax=Muraenolepis orangiensis TaxID=630683 RepID=A0A9Q0DFP0_9TELE|nr:hypothetical protein NHX12_011093 [Muraenolepis orangiensis]